MKLTNQNTNQEIIFVAQPDTTGYKFDLVSCSVIIYLMSYVCLFCFLLDIKGLTLGEMQDYR